MKELHIVGLCIQQFLDKVFVSVLPFTLVHIDLKLKGSAVDIFYMIP